jgi:phosphatidate cytidylyltransferase
LLKARLATAAVGIPILIGVTLAGGWWFAVVAALALTAAAAEYLRAGGIRWQSPEGAATLAATAAVLLIVMENAVWRERTLVLGLFALMLALVIHGEWWPERADLTFLERAFATCAGVLLYLGWLGGYLVLVRELPDGRDWFLTVLFVTWTADTAAYATGRLFGRRPFAPNISPKKTWEGTAAAAPGAVVAMIFCWAVFDLPDLGAGEAVLLGLVLAVGAVIGDLFESLLKRGFHIKDASNLLPGHGGFLDRVDSVLVVGALVYFAVTWVLT